MESEVSTLYVNARKPVAQRSRTMLLRAVGLVLLASTVAECAWAQLAPADQQEFNSRFAGTRIEADYDVDEFDGYLDVQANGRFEDQGGDSGRIVYRRIGPNTGRYSFGYDDPSLSACDGDLTFISETHGTFAEVAGSNPFLTCNLGGTWRVVSGPATEPDTTEPDTSTPVTAPPLTESRAVTDVVKTVVAATAANVAANVSARFSAVRGGSSVVVGGQTTRFGPGSATMPVPLHNGRDREPAMGRGGMDESRDLGLGDLLASSAFEVSLDASDDGTPNGGAAAQWTVWGRGDIQLFEADPERGSKYDGDLQAGYLGVDAWIGERLLAGVAGSVTQADADYSVVGGSSAADGRLEMSLSSVHPYLRYAADAGSELWVVLGAGQGDIEVRRTGSTVREKSDLTMWMGSAGGRRALKAVGTVDLAVLGDVGFARVETDAGQRIVDGLNVDATRVRVGLEASRTTVAESGSAVTPFVEVAGRFDGGDGDKEVGLEVSPGLHVSNPDTGFGLEARGRILALRSGEDYREYGAGLTASVSPGPNGAGLSLSVSPRWGTDTTGVDALRPDGLWRDDDLGRAGAADRNAMSLDARVGYGITTMRGLLTPFGELGWRAERSRRVRVGARFLPAGIDAGSFSLELSGERYESGATAPDHRLRLIGQVRF